MLALVRKFVPTPLLLAYHRVLSWVAAALYGHPSEQLIVVGVTGTNGKTSTVYLIAKALEAAGKTGCTTTALFKIDQREWLNTKKMTMLGRFQLQKMLREMVTAGCRYVVIETSSQGIVQSRHKEINYDICVLTNLTPEHIEAHGSFEKYKQAKIELFRHLAQSRRKMIEGKVIPKVAVLNQQSEHAKDFAVNGLDHVVWYGAEADVRASMQLPGEVNVENGSAALAVATSLGIPREAALQRLGSVLGIPGRFERIDEGQSFTVVVDYAVEPVAMEKLYETVRKMSNGRILHVFGSCGGGRDVARRPLLGALAAKRADEIFVTNEDPYDDDPRQIMEQIAHGAREAGVAAEKLHVIEDRRQAIEAAIKAAQPGDVVLLTGKGSEQAIVGKNGVRIPWDERTVAREALQRYAVPHVQS